MSICSCSSCGAPIVWLKTVRGKNIPVNASTVKDPNDIYDFQRGHIAHWGTCANAEQHRKPKVEGYKGTWPPVQEKLL